MKTPNEILREIEEAFYDIPFENSDYQNKAFVLAAQITPARAYRAIGLRMSSKLRAINELKWNRQREQVDIDEWQSVIDSPDNSIFDKRRAQINIDEKLSHHTYTDKLLNDAIHELNLLYSEFKKFPKYTRDQFEQEEHHHFELSLQNQLENSKNPAASGVLDSIKSMHHYATISAQLDQINQLENTL